MGLAGKGEGSGGPVHCPCDQCSQHLCPTDSLLSNIRLVCPIQPDFFRSHLPLPLRANLKTSTERHLLTAELMPGEDS